MKPKLLYIIVALLIIDSFITFEVHKQSATQMTMQINTLREETDKLQRKIDSLTNENIQIKAQMNKLTQQAKQSEAQKANRGGERLTSLGTYTITAYCSCTICCGEYAKNRPGGIVTGAAGVELKEGISVASPLPFGTEIMVDGHRYTVQDRTAKWIAERYDGRIIDVYYSNHAEALEWGKREVDVWEVRQE
jgi:3D (Asp-Asp-Asp) domain-containing protein